MSDEQRCGVLIVMWKTFDVQAIIGTQGSISDSTM